MDQVFDLCYIDQWFLDQIKEIVDCELSIKNKSLDAIQSSIKDLKSSGFSDKRLANLIKTNEVDVRNLRKREGVKPVFKRIDTCAAEFESSTAYMYSTYSDFCESNPSKNKKVVILGGGPNRIGQGIEFDCYYVPCIHGTKRCWI